MATPVKKKTPVDPIPAEEKRTYAAYLMLEHSHDNVKRVLAFTPATVPGLDIELCQKIERLLARALEGPRDHWRNR